MLKCGWMCQFVILFLLQLLFGGLLYGQGQGLIAQWSFARDQDATPRDTVNGVKGKIKGYYKYVPGVSGDGLRFDGYTTSITISSRHKPEIGTKGFTVEAWLALNTYPWNWVPVVDQEKESQEGFAFGIDAFGHVGLEASIDGQWRKVVSKERLHLKKWAHITGTYETEGNQGLMKIYLDGKQVGQLAVRGEFTPARRTDILIGRVRQPTMPFPEGAIHPFLPIWYSLDGILDEVEIYDRSMSGAQIAGAYAVAKAPSGDVLPWQKMPSGPPGAGHFGAYYATLHYQDTWDRLRRIGPDSDVVVRFDESPIRLVFWQGTGYMPAWVSENDKWYVEQFLETWGRGCPDGGDCEVMSDKQDRYSHVKILESNNARAVVEWRYALNEVEHYKIAAPNPYTGWGEWADEFWTIYPDGVAAHKQILHSSPDVFRTHGYEWQNAMVLNQPGTRPDDNINSDALTLENMQGKTKTYTWKPKPAGTFTRVNAPWRFSGPPDPNIELINLKSKWKPFQIIPPDGAKADLNNGEKTYFNFTCWNHWPVAQITSSGRPCVAPDRASHSGISHLYWKSYSQQGDMETKIFMDGMTTKPVAELIPLAKSWLSPPKMQAEGNSYQSAGYDPTQRAYVLTKTGSGTPAALKLTFDASAASPIYDPAIVIKNWGEGGARLEINGKPVVWDKNYREGHIHRLGGTDLVVWLQRQTNEPLRVGLSAAAQ